MPLFFRLTSFSVALRLSALFLFSEILFSISAFLLFKPSISLSRLSAFSLPPLSSVVSVLSLSLCTSAVLSFNFSAAVSSFARLYFTLPTYKSSITPPSAKRSSSFAFSSSSLVSSISLSRAALRISCSASIFALRYAARSVSFSSVALIRSAFFLYSACLSYTCSAFSSSSFSSASRFLFLSHSPALPLLEIRLKRAFCSLSLTVLKDTDSSPVVTILDSLEFISLSADASLSALPNCPTKTLRSKAAAESPKNLLPTSPDRLSRVPADISVRVILSLELVLPNSRSKR